jgi:hypothetical protein
MVRRTTPRSGKPDAPEDDPEGTKNEVEQKDTDDRAYEARHRYAIALSCYRLSTIGRHGLLLALG